MTATTAPPGRFTRAVTLGVILVVQLMVILDGTIVNVALPTIRTELEVSPATLSWVLNGYAIAFGGLLLLGGRLGDAFGFRSTFVVGNLVFVAASLLGGLAPNHEVLIAARVLQGVGSALAAPAVLALLTIGAVDDADRHRRLALFSLVAAAGGTVGLILGGLLTESISWRWTLFVNVPIGLVAVALAPRFLPDTDRSPGRFDVAGAVTGTLGAAALVNALISAADHGWTAGRTLASALVAAIAIVGFVLQEQHTPSPLVRLGLLTERSRAGALLNAAILVGGQMSMFFLLVLLLQQQLGFSPLQTGVAFVPLTFMIFVGSRLAPRLVERFDPRSLMIVGSLGVAASMLVFSLDVHAPAYWPLVVGGLVVNGASISMLFMPGMAVALRDVPAGDTGAVSGVVQTAQQVGGALGFAVIVGTYTAGNDAGPVPDGMSTAFGVAAAMAVLAAGAAAVVRRRVSDA